MKMDQPEGRYHYQLMRRALEAIDASEVPLSLEALAGEMQMSTAHFQRVFSAWVGVSPKRYQQYLQLGQAKRMLNERFTTRLKQRNLLDCQAADGCTTFFCVGKQ